MARHAMPQTRLPLTEHPAAQIERRFLAAVIDRLIAWSIAGVVGFIAWLLIGADAVAIAVAVLGSGALIWLVFALVLGVSGMSPGKSATGLRVIEPSTGAPIGVGPALLRALILALAGVPTFGIGLATLAWTAAEDGTGQRRGWHDRRAGSVVVDVRPAPVMAQVDSDEAPRHIVNLTALRLVPAPSPQQPPTPTRAPDQSMRRQLTDGSGATSATQFSVQFDHGDGFVVDGLVLVGRNPQAHAGEVVSRLVSLPSADMSISKTHAQFGPAEDGVLVVMDRGSTNGTSVIRHGVVRQLEPGRPTTLLDADVVVFGDRQMSVSLRG